MIKARMQDGDDGGDEDDLKGRGANHDVSRHAQEIDHGRHHDEAATDAEKRGEQADHPADDEWRYGADIETRAREPHFQRQAVDPIMLPRPTAARRPASAG